MQLLRVISSIVCIAAAPGSFAQHSAESLASLIVAYRNGDFRASIPLLQALAASGNADAQAVVCEATLLGRGVVKRAELYEKCQAAADTGIPLAQGIIAVAKMVGPPGIAVDYGLAAAWAELGARRNDPRSVRVLGDLSFYGLGKPVNERQAQLFYERAAQLGDAQASAMLAWIFSGFASLPPDHAYAYMHANTAARGGRPLGQAVLGWLHENGIVVVRNANEAVRW